MAKKAETQAVAGAQAGGIAPSKPPNRATICDYDHSVLSGVIRKLKVGESANIRLGGTVTRIEEHYSNGKHSDPYNNRCEIELTPTSVVLAGGKGNMVSEMNSERKKRGGGYYKDEEDD